MSATFGVVPATGPLATEATLAAMAARLPATLPGGWLGVTIEGQLAPVAVTGTFSLSGGPVDQGLPGALAWKVDGSGVTQPVSAAALPLPTGAASEATLATRASEATLLLRASEATLATRASEATLATLLTTAAFQARVPTLGQKAMAGSLPVVFASDQTALSVSQASLPWLVATTGANTVAVAAPTLTKGAQGAQGFSVQPLRDAGRARRVISLSARRSWRRPSPTSSPSSSTASSISWASTGSSGCRCPGRR